MKLSLVIAISLSLATTFRNAPASAESTTPSTTKVIAEPALGALQLTPQEVEARNQKLAPIYTYYAKTNLAQVANALEQTYKMNVYHHIDSTWTADMLQSKAGIMAAAVQYSINGDSTATQACLATGYLLNRVNPVELGFKDRILIDHPANSGLVLVNGKESSPPYDNCDLFSLSTAVTQNRREVMSGFDPLKAMTFGLYSHPHGGFETKSYSLFSTLPLMSVERPQLFRLLLALRDSQLRALDATVVFVNSNQLRVVDRDSQGHYFAPIVPWKVVYPGFSRVAPIPQPIIFISESATDEDLLRMVKTEAPLIYAYNKLFDLQILPQQTAIQASLARISNTNAQVAKLAKIVGEANAREAAQRAYLSVAYGLLASTTAPIEGAGHVASDLAHGLYDIFTTPVFENTFIYSPSYGITSYSATAISQTQVNIYN